MRTFIRAWTWCITATNAQLEYDFVLAPGADPRQIELSFDGAKRLRLDAGGNLIVDIAGGEVIEHKPVIYQDIAGIRRRVAGGYELRSGHRVGFKLAGYHAHRRLTIDPSLVYSTYLGGSNSDQGTRIAVDSSGNAYVIGSTSSSNFPTTVGAFQTTLRTTPPSDNAFVSKLNSSGSALVYSTYLGGSNTLTPVESGNGIAVDSSGNAYVTGSTGSSDFPTTPGAFQTTLRGTGNAFVSKLNSSGSALVYSTYLGGSTPTIRAMELRWTRRATPTSPASPIPVTFRPRRGRSRPLSGGTGNAFVSKLNSSGSALVYSTYLGGSGGSDRGYGIALDSSGNAYVTGSHGLQ